MKSFNVVISFVILYIFVQSIVTAQDAYDINVIMIGIGEKNPTFDESYFPNLEFYYTPNLVSQAELNETGKSALSLFVEEAREVFEGEPEILAKWWDEMDLKNYALVFDKNGIGAWQGKLELDDNLVEDSDGEGKENSLEDTFEMLLKDGNVMELDKEKEFDCGDDDSIIETNIPDFEVIAVDSSKKSVLELTKSGKTTMVVFFQIPKDADLMGTDAVKKEEGGLTGLINATVQVYAGFDWIQLMEKLESNIYGNEIDPLMGRGE